MRTIIAGTRDIVDYDVLKRVVDEVPWTITRVLNGGARGVDLLGVIWATENNIPVDNYPANWKAYGRSAGPMRNAQMAMNADCLIAIWDGKSAGTKNMIEIARRAGLEVVVYCTSQEKTA